jgi:hypothetical protein
MTSLMRFVAMLVLGRDVGTAGLRETLKAWLRWPELPLGFGETFVAMYGCGLCGGKGFATTGISRQATAGSLLG